MEIIPEAFSSLYRQAFILVINSLDSPDNKLTMHCTPKGTSTGKDKHGQSIGLSIGSAKFKHERNAIMQHQPVFKLHPVQLPVDPPLSKTHCQCHSHSVNINTQQLALVNYTKEVLTCYLLHFADRGDLRVQLLHMLFSMQNFISHTTSSLHSPPTRTHRSTGHCTCIFVDCSGH